MERRCKMNKKVQETIILILILIVGMVALLLIWPNQSQTVECEVVRAMYSGTPEVDGHNYKLDCQEEWITVKAWLEVGDIYLLSEDYEYGE
jgi:hypothetical protein